MLRRFFQDPSIARIPAMMRAPETGHQQRLALTCSERRRNQSCIRKVIFSAGMVLAAMKMVDDHLQRLTVQAAYRSSLLVASLPAAWRSRDENFSRCVSMPSRRIVPSVACTAAPCKHAGL